MVAEWQDVVPHLSNNKFLNSFLRVRPDDFFPQFFSWRYNFRPLELSIFEFILLLGRHKPFFYVFFLNNTIFFMILFLIGTTLDHFLKLRTFLRLTSFSYTVLWYIFFLITIISYISQEKRLPTPLEWASIINWFSADIPW